MAVRDWHPGQLPVVWLGVLFVEWVLWGLGSTGEMPRLLYIVFFVLPLLLLALTWVWFGGRKKE